MIIVVHEIQLIFILYTHPPDPGGFTSRRKQTIFHIEMLIKRCFNENKYAPCLFDLKYVSRLLITMSVCLSLPSSPSLPLSLSLSLRPPFHLNILQPFFIQFVIENIKQPYLTLIYYGVIDKMTPSRVEYGHLRQKKVIGNLGGLVEQLTMDIQTVLIVWMKSHVESFLDHNVV